MKKKDLYKIIKEIIKEQRSPVDLDTGIVNVDDVDTQDLADVNSKFRKKGQGRRKQPTDGNIEAPRTTIDVDPTGDSTVPTTIDWDPSLGCVGGAYNYGTITLHPDTCDGTTDVQDDSFICCGSNNNSNNPAEFSDTVTLSSYNPSFTVLSFQDEQCFCPNAEYDDQGGTKYENPNTGNSPLNPNLDDGALICCNCVVDIPWDSDPNSVLDATITSILPFTVSDLETWMDDVNPNTVAGLTTLSNFGAKCAGCNDPAASNYQTDDTGTTNNQNIYGCAAGSVDGVTSENYAGIENQTANDIGCCIYEGCMQYGASLNGSIAFDTQLFATALATSPTSNMSDGVGTPRGTQGLWIEDGSCTWTGCTYSTATNIGQVSNQQTSLYPAALFTNGANAQFTEDGSCQGTYGCTEEVGIPDFATGAAPFGGGNDFPPATGTMKCAGCPDPTMFNTYAGDDVDTNGNPLFDCAGNTVQVPGDMTQGSPDVTCCTATAAGCMDDGTAANIGNYVQGGQFSAGVLQNANGEDRPANWNPDGSGGTFPACNYNASANTDDGSCIYTACVGCTSEAFDLTGTTLAFTSTTTPIDTSTFVNSYDDGSCLFDGCLEYDIQMPGMPVPVTTDNYVCIINPDLCDGVGPNAVPDTATFGNSAFTDSVIPNPPGICTISLIGCTDSTACTYDPNATINDASACGYPSDQCHVCKDVGAGNGSYGANQELDGTEVPNPDCECINVTAYRCNREDVTRNFGCMTIGGNDPAVGDEFMVPMEMADKDKEIQELPEGLNEKVDPATLGTVYIVDSISTDLQYIKPNYSPATCTNMNWKCFCPMTGLNGWNGGTPGTSNSHPHMCVQTTEPVPPNQNTPPGNFVSPPIFATYSECRDTFGCYNAPGAKIAYSDEKGGDCHVSPGGQVRCMEPDSERDIKRIEPSDMPILPGMDIDTSVSAVPGLEIPEPDVPISDAPPTDRAISESKKLRKALKEAFINKIKKSK